MILKVAPVGKIEDLKIYVNRFRQALYRKLLTVPNTHVITGTLSAASGSIAHGLTNIQDRVLVCQGWNSTSGTAIPLTVTSITNTNINYSGGTSGWEYRFVIMIQDEPDTNWP